MRRPAAGEYHPYFEHYINLTRGVDFLQNIQDSGDQLVNTLNELGGEKGDFTYEKGKWTIKQMLQHIIDTEMVFTYRAVSIARGDISTKLPGFEQNEWAEVASVKNQSLKDLVETFTAQRQFIGRTFRSFSQEDLDKIGNTNGSPCNALSLGFMIAGHCFHHTNILKERY